MKISKLALIALLGGALMAFGCSSDSGSGGSGGSAGSGGEGGEGGAGGAGGGTGGAGGGTGGVGGGEPLTACPALEGQQTATYELTCVVMGAIPATTEITVFASNGGGDYMQESEGELTTCAELFIPDDTFNLIGALNPELTSGTAQLAVGGASPDTVDHLVPGTPFALEQTTVFDEVTTTIMVASEPAVTVDPAAAEIVVTVPGIGEVIFIPGEGDCGDLELLLGEEPISFDTIL